MLFVSLELFVWAILTIGHGYVLITIMVTPITRDLEASLLKYRKDKSFYRMYASINDAYSVNNSLSMVIIRSLFPFSI